MDNKDIIQLSKRVGELEERLREFDEISKQYSKEKERLLLTEYITKSGWINYNSKTEKFTLSKGAQKIFKLKEDIVNASALLVNIHDEDKDAFITGFSKNLIENEEKYLLFKLVENANIKWIYASICFNIKESELIVEAHIQDISKDKEQIDELEDSAAIIDTTELLSDSGWFTYNKNKDIIDLSAGVKNIYSLEVNSVKREDMFSFIYNDDLSNVKDSLYKTYTEGEIPSQPIFFRINVEGEVKWIKSRLVKRYINDDNDLVYNGYIQDITECKTKDAAIFSQKEHITSIHKKFGFGSYKIDLITGIIYDVKDLVKMFNTEGDNPYNFTSFVNNFVHPDDKMLVQNSYNECFKGNAHKDLIFRVVLFDNKTIWLKESCEIIEENGKKYIVGEIQDVSNIEKYISKVSYSIEFLNNLIKNTPAPIFVKEIDNDFRFLTFNKAYSDTFNDRTTDFYGKTDFDIFVRKEDAEKIRLIDTQIAESKIPKVETYELQNNNDIKKYQTIKWIANLKDHKSPLLIGITFDISNI